MHLLPNPNSLKVTANGRLYTGVANTPQDVLDIDANILMANGWQFLPLSSAAHAADHAALQQARTWNASYALAQQCCPSGIAPTGSVDANGALTLGTALARIYGPTASSPGIWLYFPAGALYTNSAAGLYWCVMTSTTAGTAYNTKPDLTTMMNPASPKAIVDAGPGAYTGVTDAEVLFAPALPAGALGLRGSLKGKTRWTWNNTAGNKSPSIDLSGTSIGLAPAARTTSVTDFWDWMLTNCGNQAMQIVTNGPDPALASATAFTAAAIDTSAALVINHKGQIGTATDWIVLEPSLVEIIPG